MSNVAIQKSTLDFLKKLSANNNREWFNDHRHLYERAMENAEMFMDGLLEKMSRHDQLETPSGKKSLYRIYSDVRFFKDRAPYTAKFSGYLRRTKPFLRGGYYIRIKPGDSQMGCGFAQPNPEDLKRIREDISLNQDIWEKLLRSKGISGTFGAMKGDLVKTAPRGFSPDDPAISLLRYKQFWFEKKFTDQEVMAPGFVNEVNKTFRQIRPFFDHMSEVLTTNVNGEPI